MNWQRRLRDMLISGGAGALAIAGCNSETHLGFCCNASADPCCPSLYCGQPVTPDCTEKMACEAKGGTLHGIAGCLVPGDAESSCCDASSDPCCPYLNCGQPPTLECAVKMACEADGGTWNSDFGGICSPPFPDSELNADAASDGPDAGP